MSETSKRVITDIPLDVLEVVDAYRKPEGYTSRAELVRDLMRKWASEQKQKYAARRANGKRK